MRSLTLSALVASLALLLPLRTSVAEAVVIIPTPDQVPSFAPDTVRLTIDVSIDTCGVVKNVRVVTPITAQNASTVKLAERDAWTLHFIPGRRDNCAISWIARLTIEYIHQPLSYNLSLSSQNSGR